MRKNWLEIWYFCTNLVTFAMVEKKSNKGKNLIAHNQECKNNYICMCACFQVTPSVILQKLHILSIIDL